MAIQSKKKPGASDGWTKLNYTVTPLFNFNGASNTSTLCDCSPPLLSNETSVIRLEKSSVPQKGLQDGQIVSPPATRPLVGPKRDIFKQLLSIAGHLCFDKTSHQYSGPTINLHMFKDFLLQD